MGPSCGNSEVQNTSREAMVKTVPQASRESNDSHSLLDSKQANTLFCRCPETLWKAEFKGMG